ncbi:hypothetical protein RclHR1_02050022 [Rhizophagus clarus]|uniref:Ribonuclease H n=1 Tax=Rhizophagus clarus TaxID=94130 RepID=A0A2Z6R412_9GLOM|nr:hypothetical protein RclHR1_02050022 [Rhizophagus clarus]GES74231.1 ribonuclease H1-like isoform X2 [Rhizophagus clarus]
MPKVKSGFYAVHIGFKPGIYYSWEECENQIRKYPNAKYKKFTTLQEAEAFVKEGNNKKVFGNSTREKPISKHISSMQQNYISSPASSVSNGKSLKVWTDGSSINNGQHGAKAGIGVYWGKDDPRNVSERLPGPRQTNNRAEIMAVIRALETCPDNNIPLEIRTDSQYVINAYNCWIPKWENNKWKTSNNKDVENKELFQRLMKLIRARNAEVTIEYVQAHVGIKENEEADQLAKLGASMDVVDDSYDYGEDNDEMEAKHQKTILQYFQTITDESSPSSIVENSQILLNNFDYNKILLTKDDSN